MSKDSNIRSYTAIDIEKYHKGLLSPREMHDLEKAALDDPFLADALEGYAVPGINVASDIAELKKRLSDRTEENRKVIPLAAPPRSSFPWLRAAAMVILVLGAAFLIYQFGFNKDSNFKEVAQNKPASTQKDSGQPSTTILPDSPKEEISFLKQATDSSIVKVQGSTQHAASGSADQKWNASVSEENIVAVPDTIAAPLGQTDANYKKDKNLVTVAPPPLAKEESRYISFDKKLEDERALRRQNQNQVGKPTFQQPVKEAKAQLDFEAIKRKND